MKPFVINKTPYLSDSNGYFMINDQQIMGPHKHEFFELTYIVDGEIEHTIGNRKSVIKSGNYFFVDIGTAHSYRPINGKTCLLWNFLFLPQMIDGALAGCERFSSLLNSYYIRLGNVSTFSSPENHIFFDDTGSVRKKLSKLSDEYRHRFCGYDEMARCLLISIMIETIRKLNPLKTDDQTKLSRAVSDYLRAHYTEPVRLSEIAEKLHYNPTYLSARFKKDTGITVGQCCQRIRIEQSCRLLVDTDWKVTEIARAVGYNNQKFFNKIFKSVTHMTPREYRYFSLKGYSLPALYSE